MRGVFCEDFDGNEFCRTKRKRIESLQLGRGEAQTAVDNSQSKDSNEEDGDWPLEPVLSFGWDAPPRVAGAWEEQLGGCGWTERSAGCVNGLEAQRDVGEGHPN